jgi:PncC family amidohydrolase
MKNIPAGQSYNLSMINKIKEILIDKQQTIAVAESVTAGHLQAGFSLATKAMQFFQGGITTYNLGQKARHFHVDPIHATNCNCVSQIIALDMAKGAGKIFSSDWGIGITGYATPDPEFNIKDLFAYYAISFKNKKIKSGRINAEEAHQLDVQVYYANTIFQAFYNVIKKR